MELAVWGDVHPDGPRGTAINCHHHRDDSVAAEIAHARRDRRATILIGGPCSGKSYLTSRVRLAAAGVAIVDSDRMKQFGAPTHHVARDMARAVLCSALPLGASLYVEGLGSDPVRAILTLGAIRAAGYFVTELYLECGIMLALRRQRERERCGGRCVPREIFDRAYAMLPVAWPLMAGMADTALVIRGDVAVPVAHGVASDLTDYAFLTDGLAKCLTLLQ